MKISDQAIESASHQRQGVDAVIPPEAIEVAAKAYRDYPKWEDLHEDGREWRREYVRAALEAAAPLLKAEAYEEGYKEGAGELPWHNPYRNITSGHISEEG